MGIRLFIQGYASQGPPPSSPGGPLYQTEFVSVSPMNTARSGHTATTLQDGKVLIVGGDNNLRTSYYNRSGIEHHLREADLLFGSMEDGGSPSPIVLAQNEGIVARITTAATGTWRFNIDMAWSEVSSY